MTPEGPDEALREQVVTALEDYTCRHDHGPDFAGLLCAQCAADAILRLPLLTAERERREIESLPRPWQAVVNPIRDERDALRRQVASLWCRWQHPEHGVTCEAAHRAALLPSPPAPGGGDDREPKQCRRCGNWCHYDGWDHVHAWGIGIESCNGQVRPLDNPPGRA